MCVLIRITTQIPTLGHTAVFNIVIQISGVRMIQQSGCNRRIKITVVSLAIKVMLNLVGVALILLILLMLLLLLLLILSMPNATIKIVDRMSLRKLLLLVSMYL